MQAEAVSFANESYSARSLSVYLGASFLCTSINIYIFASSAAYKCNGLYLLRCSLLNAACLSFARISPTSLLHTNGIMGTCIGNAWAPRYEWGWWEGGVCSVVVLVTWIGCMVSARGLILPEAMKKQIQVCMNRLKNDDCKKSVSQLQHSLMALTRPFRLRDSTLSPQGLSCSCPWQESFLLQPEQSRPVKSMSRSTNFPHYQWFKWGCLGSGRSQETQEHFRQMRFNDGGLVENRPTNISATNNVLVPFLTQWWIAAQISTNIQPVNMVATSLLTAKSFLVNWDDVIIDAVNVCCWTCHQHSV